MKKVLTILIIAMVFAIGCKKDNDVVDPEVQLATDIVLIETYLLEHDITATKTESSLYYVIDVQGEGTESPIATSKGVFKYRGYFLDGTVFDQTHGNNVKTFDLGLTSGGLIAGMVEGIQLLHVGDEARLFIPSGLGYGPIGTPTIPGNISLIFEVELVSFTNE